MCRSLRLILVTLFFVTSILNVAQAQQSGNYAFKIAVIKYGGGGDWYQGKTPLPNLIEFVRKNTLVDIDPQPDVVEPGSTKLFNYPFLFISGHGNISFTPTEAENLRQYLTGGGFLYIDDDYGLDTYIRREMKKVLPNAEFVELPYSHPIYSAQYGFTALPKIHEHDNKAPQGFAVLLDGRVAVYYTYETNISDGWEAPEVHHDPETVRQEALRMGANILVYALTR